MTAEKFRKIIEEILRGEISSKAELERRKAELGLQHVRDSEILKHASPEERRIAAKVLMKKPTRTISGIAIVATMTKPLPCPHGKCRYCPGGPSINLPQSYTGEEPTTRRAIAYGYDPYLQVTFRLKQLRDTGHPISKVELIVMGGTLTAQCIDYQEWFVKECLRAMNDFEANYELLNKLGEEGFLKSFERSPRDFHYLEDFQAANERARVRCVGITFEPRPDYAKQKEINEMLRLGVTRVEVGVQMPFDFVYERVKRGHRVQDVVEATQLLKDSAFKICYHMMPGLLGEDGIELDLEGFKLIFEDERFRPDMLKIYPCLILKGTEYYELWRRGELKPLSFEETLELVVRIKQMLPPWVRTMRIMRDIPAHLIEAGARVSNLAELAEQELERRGIRCKCIRCREVGRLARKDISPKPEDIRLVRREYSASGGKEIFISFEDVVRDVLIGFLRLRFPWRPFRPEIDEHTALVRELHVYGPMVEVGEEPTEEWQHRGYGKELLEEAERISREEFDAKRILVISGIGAREYYRKFGYARVGPYMGKELT